MRQAEVRRNVIDHCDRSGIETMMREHPGRDPLPVIIWSAGRQSGIQRDPELFGAAYLCDRSPNT